MDWDPQVSVGFMFFSGVLLFAVAVAAYTPVDIYTGGQEGYYCYRIPDLILTSNGTLLAFTEARKENCGDHGWVDLVVKRSDDLGKTWSNITLVYSNSTSTKYNTVGNAVPVQDRESKRILVPFCLNNLQVFMTYSDDDGRTWATPTPIPVATQPAWTWVAAGPPTALQLTSGRIVFPINHHEQAWATDGRMSIIYTDDVGVTWKMGGTSIGDATPNESQAVELGPDVVLVNSRSNYDYRYQTVSADGGLSFGNTTKADLLIEPAPGGCEGSIFKHPETGLLLYSGPSDPNARQNMTLYVSKDYAQTWSVHTIVDKGMAAYSSLAVLPDGTVALAYETNNYQSVTLAYISL